MSDLYIVFRIALKHKFKLIFIVFLSLALLFLSGGERLLFVSISPDKGYRLEHYSPRIYQRLMHYDFWLPGFVRLYNNHNNRYFGESQVVDFSGGDAKPFWDMNIDGKVVVGMSIRYQGVPPLDELGNELPIPAGSMPVPAASP